MLFKRNSGKAVPITLLTGYLGAGKTTLLNNILRDPQGHKIAVIVNDIGEVNIDAELIAKGGAIEQEDDGTLVPLSNGCICCTLKKDLMDQIETLIKKGKFDYIVIEASGICEPIPIAQTITAMDQMYRRGEISVSCRLDNIVSVVDALRLAEEFECGASFEEVQAQEAEHEHHHHHHDDEDDEHEHEHEHHDHDHDEHEEHEEHEEHHDEHDEEEEEDIASLLVQQMEFCNTVLLNKADLVTKEQKEQIRVIINALNPGINIIETNYCKVDMKKILDTKQFDLEKVYESAGWIRALEHGEHHHSVQVLEYGINTFVYNNKHPFDMAKVDEAFKKLKKTVIRSKGFVWFKEDPSYVYVLEQCGPQVTVEKKGMWAAALSPEEQKEIRASYPEVDSSWDAKYGDRLNKLVFIGQGIDQEAITKIMDSCLTDI
ncbi:MAG TPA: hypothetical protein DCG28_03310 [Lachnospiraceae bacterium]|nr:hypothetical protein [Lachnospiraceae bacterium]